MGKEAYQYGFPLTEFGLIRAADLKLSAPLNVLANAQELATPSAKGVVAPNTDTLYSLAQIDLAKGPVVLKVPKMDGRYWTFEFVEPYTNVVGYIGSRLNGFKGGTWALQWDGAAAQPALPKGVKAFKSSSRRLWVIGRTLVSGNKDQAKAKKLMAQYRLGTLAALKAGKALPAPRKLTPGRPKTVEPTGLAFLDFLSASMTADPPPIRDAEIVARMQHYGIGVGLKTSAADLPAPVLEGLAAGVDAAAAALPMESKLPVLTQAKANGGWYNPAAQVGAFGTDYLMRARCQKDLLALKELLPELEPYSVPGSDYAWRAVISQKNWQHALTQLAAEVDYPNFKDAVKDQLHKQAYMNVWADLLVLQQWPDQD